MLDVHSDTFWIPIGGGHNDYAGNESYKVRLDGNAPSWSMVHPPSGSIPAPASLAENNTNTYSDGRPRATHTYNNCVHVPGRGIYMVANATPYPLGYGYAGDPQRTWLMNESTGEWSGTPALMPVSTITSGACFDTLRRALWCQGQGDEAIRYLALETVGATWQTAGAQYGTGYAGHNALTHVAEHDLILMNSRVSNIDALRIFDPVTNLWHIPTLQGGAPAFLRWDGQCHAHWVPALGCLCFWNNNSNTTVISTLTPTGNLRSDPWVWGSLSVAGSNTVSPTARTALGTYGRFQYSPRLHGFYVLNGVSQAVYFFALS